MIAVTVRVNNHCPTFLWWRFTVSCRIIENMLYSIRFFISGSTKTFLIFKISKINFEYVEIFPTEIPQCLQRRHWGVSAFLTYDVTKVVPTKVHLALYHIGCIYYQNRCISIEYILNVR